MSTHVLGCLACVQVEFILDPTNFSEYRKVEYEGADE
jgi:hypothetical protein